MHLAQHDLQGFEELLNENEQYTFITYKFWRDNIYRKRESLDVMLLFALTLLTTRS